MTLLVAYAFFICGFFGLLLGISGEDLKAKDAPMLLLLAILWPYVVYLWFKDHYFDRE